VFIRNKPSAVSKGQLLRLEQTLIGRRSPAAIAAKQMSDHACRVTAIGLKQTSLISRIADHSVDKSHMADLSTT
jgi:hypothetical protein